MIAGVVVLVLLACTVVGSCTLQCHREYQFRRWLGEMHLGPPRRSRTHGLPLIHRAWSQTEPNPELADWLDRGRRIPEVSARLHAAVKHRNLSVARNAAYALRDLGDDGTCHVLTELLKAPEYELRETAAISLSAFPSDRTVLALRRVLEQDDNELVRASTVYSLASIGTITAWDAVTGATFDRSELVRETAERLLREAAAPSKME